MNEATTMRFPPQRALLAMAGRMAIGLLFIGVGTAGVVTTFWGEPIEWADGGALPTWASVLLGLVFAAVGVIILARPQHAVINCRRGWVKAWPDLTATFRRRCDLSAFEKVRVVGWPEDADAPEGYTLWLIGASHTLLLETFEIEQAAEATERAKTVAARLDLPIDLAPTLANQTD
ncbi:MAG: hypothetical protein ACODAQ_04125 [Phycisphaeraceae bacterium]